MQTFGAKPEWNRRIRCQRAHPIKTHPSQARPTLNQHSSLSNQRMQWFESTAVLKEY